MTVYNATVSTEVLEVALEAALAPSIHSDADIHSAHATSDCYVLDFDTLNISSFSLTGANISAPLCDTGGDLGRCADSNNDMCCICCESTLKCGYNTTCCTLGCCKQVSSHINDIQRGELSTTEDGKLGDYSNFPSYMVCEHSPSLLGNRSWNKVNNIVDCDNVENEVQHKPLVKPEALPTLTYVRY